VKGSPLRVAMVTPWGTKCGIAAYSAALAESLDDDRVTFSILTEYGSPPETSELVSTVACWLRYSDDIDALKRELLTTQADLIHIQLQWFHSPVVMAEVIECALSTGRPVIIQFHNTLADGGSTEALEAIAGPLGRVSRIIVHGGADASRLTSLGLQEKLEMMPLGQVVLEDESAEAVRARLGIVDRYPVIGTFGYLLPHKGVLETIRAIALLRVKYPRILYVAACAIYPHHMSVLYLQECRNAILELGLDAHITLATEFLPERASATLLQACDVLALPYLPTQESASAAVRFALSVHRPVVVTDREIFSAVETGVFTIKDESPESIASGIEQVLTDPQLATRLVSGADALLATSSWAAVGRQYSALLRAVVGSRS